MTAQQQNALDKANARRQAVAGFKEELRVLCRVDGAMHLANLIDPPDGGDQRDDLQGMKAYAALVCVRGIANTKATYMLRQAGINRADMRVRELTLRQRKVIAHELRVWA